MNYVKNLMTFPQQRSLRLGFISTEWIQYFAW